MAVAICLAGYGYYRWSAPYWLMRRFVGAVERKDARTIYELSDPRERREARVTPAAVALMLDRVLPDPIRAADEVHDPGIPGGWHGGPDGRQCQWIVYWSDPRTGRALPGKAVTMRPQLGSTVVVKPTPEGWRVLVGVFFLGTCQHRWGPRPGNIEFVKASTQAGMTGYVHMQGKLRDFRDLLQF
jgi:hypothetical protein